MHSCNVISICSEFLNGYLSFIVGNYMLLSVFTDLRVIEFLRFSQLCDSTYFSKLDNSPGLLLILINVVAAIVMLF